MPSIPNFSPAAIAQLEQALGIKLPSEYLQFVTGYPFPELTYMAAEDLIELHEMKPELIIRINENLRDRTLNPFHWREDWLSVGERADDEAVFYIELKKSLSHEKEKSPVYLLEAGDQTGLPVGDSFAVWADMQVQALAKMDEECKLWRANQKLKPWWKFRW